jgi:hypothetical protein
MKAKVLLVALFASGFAASVALANPSAIFKKKPPTKVTLCHLTGSKKLVTIRVAPSAVRAHLRRGDKRGACPGSRTKTVTVTVTVTGPTTTVTVTQTATTSTTASSTTSTSATTTTSTSSASTTTTTTSTTTTNSTSTAA